MCTPPDDQATVKAALKDRQHRGAASVVYRLILHTFIKVLIFTGTLASVPSKTVEGAKVTIAIFTTLATTKR